MTKKIIFVSILSLLLFFALSDFGLAAATCDPTNPSACPKGQGCTQREVEGGGVEYICARVLEITYPGIPGGVVPETTATGLPNYVKYIFQLAVIITGFVIFGALMKNGIQYLVSSGDPAKMADSREGIFSAFLGVIILLSAYIIFNTINPQLKILTLQEVSPLAQVVVSGVYVCNYDVDEIEGGINIGKILDEYVWANEDIDREKGHGEYAKGLEAQKEAAKKLKEIMANPEKNEFCPRVNFSGNFDNFTVSRNNTMFIIPSLRYVYDEGRKKNEKRIIYEYGVVLHEKDNQRGSCDYYPKEDTAFKLYSNYAYIDLDISDYKFDAPDKDFKSARSITLFKRPVKPPGDEDDGIVLFKCVNWNQTASMCPDGELPEGGDTGYGFKPQIGDIRKIDIYGLDDKGRELSKNARSLLIYGPYFALLFDGDEKFKGNCALVSADDNYLLNNHLDYCGRIGCGPWAGSSPLFLWFDRDYKCAPCLRSMIVIEGQVL